MAYLLTKNWFVAAKVNMILIKLLLPIVSFLSFFLLTRDAKKALLPTSFYSLSSYINTSLNISFSLSRGWVFVFSPLFIALIYLFLVKRDKRYLIYSLPIAFLLTWSHFIYAYVVFLFCFAMCLLFSLEVREKSIKINVSNLLSNIVSYSAVILLIALFFIPKFYFLSEISTFIEEKSKEVKPTTYDTLDNLLTRRFGVYEIEGKIYKSTYIGLSTLLAIIFLFFTEREIIRHVFSKLLVLFAFLHFLWTIVNLPVYSLLPLSSFLAVESYVFTFLLVLSVAFFLTRVKKANFALFLSFLLMLDLYPSCFAFWSDATFDDRYYVNLEKVETFLNISRERDIFTVLCFDCQDAFTLHRKREFGFGFVNGYDGASKIMKEVSKKVIGYINENGLDRTALSILGYLNVKYIALRDKLVQNPFYRMVIDVYNETNEINVKNMKPVNVSEVGCVAFSNLNSSEDLSEIRFNVTNNCNRSVYVVIKQSSFRPWLKIVVDGEEKPYFESVLGFPVVEIKRGEHEVIAEWRDEMWFYWI